MLIRFSGFLPGCRNRIGKALYGGAIFGETGNANYGACSYERLQNKIIDFLKPVSQEGKPVAIENIFRQYHYKPS